ncbi:DNA-directed DNA polymerase alpha catalytic subunit pol1 [Coemansia sp. RSA 1646]|nr:DNA-directed DNA polymerase alpha catalytic subunit pol1 [Coemansia sp. RSA 1646]
MSSPVSRRRLRSTGAKGKSQNETESKFARLRRLRATGESAISLLKENDDSEDEEDQDMYMKVDEDDYQSIIRKGGGSLHDFVVDDDGSGYADDSLDDIGASSSFAGTRSQTKLGGSRNQKHARTPKGAGSREAPTVAAKPSVRDRDRNISTMFKNAHLKTPKQKKSRAPDDEAFMASLMDDLDGPTTPSRSAKRRPTNVTTPTYSERRRATASVRTTGGGYPLTPMPKPVGITDISNPALDPFALPPAKKIRHDLMDDPFGSISLPPFAEEEEQIAGSSGDVDIKPRIHDDDAMDLDVIRDEALEDLNDLQPFTDDAAVDVKPVIQDDPLYAAEDDDSAQGKSWMAVQQEMAIATHAPQITKQESTLPANDSGEAPATGMVHMYWIDALEKNGNLYLIGKVRANSNDLYQSCCVKVAGLERNVFLLPRINPATNERYSALDVHREFDTIAPKHGVRKFACKPVERKYAFEVLGVPASAEYLKVVYGFDQPQLPAELSGQTFTHAFGTTYSALELFLLKRRMMGPCWVAIRNAHRVVEACDRLSWCRDEYSVGDPKNICVMSDDEIDGAHVARVPPMTTLTMSLKTVMNHKDNRNEVVAISMLVHRNASLDDPTPAAKRSGSQHTVIRQLTGIPLPADFARAAQSQSSRGLSIEVTKSEAALLNFFTAFIYRTDPDIVAAHNFYGFDLDVLLHRMHELRIDGWSKLGRLRRTQWPKLQAGGGGMGESTFGERQIVAGRVICDTYMTSKDLIRAKSYALTSLASQELQIKRDEIPFERIPEFFASSKQLLHFVRHTAFDAFLAAALMIHLQALPLTKQLTTLAGNLWSRTLMGARAERNEFLLLHEFYRNKFIRPDKFFGNQSQPPPQRQPPQQKQQAIRGGQPAAAASLQAEMAEAIDQQEVDDDDDDAVDASSSNPMSSRPGGTTGRRKPAFLGGLVLEPKRGLYDRFVLLLDFNSLYPSIIQEFNICFTTVLRSSSDKENVPDAPAPDLPQGILPRLLKTLVERRRQVKRLLKQPGLSAEETGQLDVRQQALKLTANSMYGCLGFTHSRFYAKPLAMLITSRGREILQATRDLALSDGLEVIYGDTDSIMIATRTASLADVYELGAQFKRRVNERYRLLELDIDGVFKRLLLLRKKKYAALLIVNPEKYIRDGMRGAYTTKLESKGLDLVRRDWCGLSHDVSDYVLKQLFADPPTKEQPATDTDAPMLDGEEGDESQVIARIHEHLARVGTAVKTQQVPLDKYIVHKGLTKPPESYPDKKSQPHVLVALRLRAKGTAVRAGDTIPYIICDARCPGLQNDGVQPENNGSYAARARHPDEIRASEGHLYPDVDWYLNQQVLPPCARLMEPLEGTDMPALAQCLGLDPSKFRTASMSSSGLADSDALRTLDSQISDTERFKHARPFVATCQACKNQFQVDGIARRAQGASSSSVVVESGLNCSHCQKLPTPASLATQLALQIRRHIREYYTFAMTCDEPACALTTRVLSAAGSRCLRPSCSGRLHQVYSDKILYNQLQYFAALFNIDRSATRLECPSTDLRVLRDRHADHIRSLAVVVDNYLAVSARKFVDLVGLSPI